MVAAAAATATDLRPRGRYLWVTLHRKQTTLARKGRIANWRTKIAEIEVKGNEGRGTRTNTRTKTRHERETKRKASHDNWNTTELLATYSANIYIPTDAQLCRSQRIGRRGRLIPRKADWQAKRKVAKFWPRTVGFKPAADIPSRYRTRSKMFWSAPTTV